MGPRTMAGSSWLRSVLILLLGLTAGCGRLVATRPMALPRPSPTPLPSVLPPLPSVTSPPPISVATPMTITVWMAADFAPTGEDLGRELEQFEATSLMVSVVIQRKAMEGKGGLESLLAAAAQVAPSVVPDVAIVNAAQATALAQKGLTRPWQDLLPPNLEQDLFPLARQLGYYAEQRIGVPLALDVQHLVYNVDKVTEAPLLWRDVLTSEALYLFPTAGKGEAQDTLLIQYMGAGGRLSDEEGSPLLEEEPLGTALARYQGLRIAGVIPAEALQLESLADCWPAYLSGRIGIVHVWASDYLMHRADLRHTSFAPIPVAGEATVTIGRGWLMVLLSQDPGRQERAARLVGWWLTPKHTAALCQATGWLPPGHAAFAQWQGEDQYFPFLRGLLEVAVLRPDLPSLWADALSEAADQVLRGELAFGDAAAQVMAVVSPR